MTSEGSAVKSGPFFSAQKAAASTSTSGYVSVEHQSMFAFGDALDGAPSDNEATLSAPLQRAVSAEIENAKSSQSILEIIFAMQIAKR